MTELEKTFNKKVDDGKIICPDCNKEVKKEKTEYHHDPPKALYSKFTEKQLLKIKNNRRLCKSCHSKADRVWNLPEYKPKPKKFKYRTLTKY